MDLLTSSKDKLAYFRIKELKDVLTQLGLNKQGKKQDLIDRILSLFSDDDAAKPHGWNKRVPVGKDIVAKLIDDIHRTLQINGATDLASKGQNGSGLSSVKPKEEVDMKIRCPCGSPLMTDSMIQCDEPRCKVWQHIGCIIIHEKSMEGIQPEVPKHFYCEICRINRADPFWVPVAQPLNPVKLTASNMPADGTNPVQSVEKTFQLTRADRDLLQKTEHDLQAWCILLNDKVSFRMQWPQYADLQVNGVPVRTTNRPGSQLLGINSRDDGPPITTFCREGINKISLSGCDARIFCIGVRIVKRRTVQQVLNLIPKETDGELFEEALARVCRCVGGGGGAAAAENADSDSDLEVVADSITVNLRCPMSGSRMKIAGRFKPCVHMGCFDLETFVELNQRSRKWQCPICLKNYSLENIIIDPYFNRITSLMRDCGEDVNEIDVKPDGSWRVKNENEVSDLARWHNPDGSVCVTAAGGDAQQETSKLRIKEEFPTDEHTSLKIGIKRNHNGIWEVSKPEDLRPNSSGNNLMERFDNPFPKVMSSGATGSYRDDEDASVNQEGGGHFEFSTNNGNEHESVNFLPPCSAANRNAAAAVTDADVIVLSDSEEENVTFISPEAVCGADPTEFGVSFPVHAPGVSESYPEDDNACLGLFSNNADDFGMPMWSLPAAPQGSGFQLFGPHTDVTDALVDEPAAQSNGYDLTTNTNMGTPTHVQNTLVGRSTAETDGLVDNPLAFGNDPSLQIFLPARPAGVSVQDEARDHTDMSNGIRTEDWISLRLGGGTSHTESVDGNGLNSRKHHASKDGRMGSSDTDNNGNNAASFFHNINNGDDGRSEKAGWRRPRSGDPFSHPRQPRSVRPRLPLSIDIDSE